MMILSKHGRRVVKNKLFKLLGVALVVVLIATLFCACDFLNFLSEITAVQINAGNGLTKVAEGEYTAKVGSNFYLKATWDNTRVSNVRVDWHVVDETGRDSIGAYHGNDFGYAFGIEDIGKTYTYYVIVRDIRSNEIKVTVEEAELSEPTITSSTHSISRGVIQQKISDGLSNVTLNAQWNEDSISPDRNITVAWFVDGIMQEGETSKSFTYDVGEISKECSVSIYVALFEDGVKKTTAQLSLEFVNSFAMVDDVELSIDDTHLNKLCDNVYYVKSAGGASACAVDMTCSVLPTNANQSTPCTWSLTTLSGTSKTEGEKTDTKVLSYGKNVIKASVQNIESRSITVYVLDYELDAIPQNVKKHMTNRYFYNGDWYDSYLSTQEDVNAFMGYAVACHAIGEGYEAYLANTTYRDSSEFSKVLSTAVNEGVDESGAFSYNITIVGDIATITFSEKTLFGIPTKTYPTTTEVEQIKGYLRYSTLETKRTSLPIDSAKESIAVANSNELYRAVANGFKPIFAADTEGQKLSALYQKARDVLLSYVSSDMSELDKVAVVYDWIVNAVDYDYDVTMESSPTYGYNAFYLEGVFNDHKAVCDGKSKAFALLCGMEGIRAVRVCGYANEKLAEYAEEDRTNPGFGHAWNKVLVDVDGDNIREWYAVDTTWGDSARQGSVNKYEYLNYAYFLKTDEELASTHLEKTKAPSTTTKKYNVYQNTYITIGGEEICLYVESVDALKKILNYSKQNGKLAICIYDGKSVLGNSHVDVAYSYIPFGNGQYVVYATSGVDF